MWALIKREIHDRVVLFVVAVIMGSVASLSTAISAEPKDLSMGKLIMVVWVWMWLAFFGALLSAAMGSAQMYQDRTRKSLMFLCTMATTRQQILMAKIIVGILWLCALLGPTAITDAVLYQLYPSVVPLEAGALTRPVTAVFMLCFASYCLGLLTGWNSGKIVPLLGWAGLVILTGSIFIIKGVGPEAHVLLAIFAAAVLVAVWHKFMATEL
jgi:ABC-type transport system involved in multi-copper enzyme maturation permease subunit